MIANEEQASPEQATAFELEMLTAANVFAGHWETLGAPTGASTAAFILLAARVYASAREPLTLEEFLHLAGSLYQRAQHEAQNGELINVDDMPQLPAS